MSDESVARIFYGADILPGLSYFTRHDHGRFHFPMKIPAVKTGPAAEDAPAPLILPSLLEMGDVELISKSTGASLYPFFWVPGRLVSEFEEMLCALRDELTEPSSIRGSFLQCLTDHGMQMTPETQESTQALLDGWRAHLSFGMLAFISMRTVLCSNLLASPLQTMAIVIGHEILNMTPVSAAERAVARESGTALATTLREFLLHDTRQMGELLHMVMALRKETISPPGAGTFIGCLKVHGLHFPSVDDEAQLQANINTLKGVVGAMAFAEFCHTLMNNTAVHILN